MSGSRPTLLILAAGMGSRYGGLKQLDPFGPQGEALMDYSVFDARRAGFSRAVFVIRRDFADAFRAQVLPRLQAALPCELVYQDRDDLPNGRISPAGRVKPWGTVQAVLAARQSITGPFVMVNADDFYGPGAFQAMAEHFKTARPGDCALAGYRLDRTLSAHGSVARAVCRTTPQGALSAMQEFKSIGRDGAGIIRDGEARFSGEEPVSMNCFGFWPAQFSQFQAAFDAFLQDHLQDSKAECLVPEVVGRFALAGVLPVRVLEGAGEWFGVTYQQDKESVRAGIAALHARGLYPADLWTAAVGGFRAVDR